MKQKSEVSDVVVVVRRTSVQVVPDRPYRRGPGKVEWKSARRSLTPMFCHVKVFGEVQ